VEEKEETMMPIRPSSTIYLQFVTEVCSVSDSSFSLSSHQKVDACLGEFEKHTHGVTNLVK